MSFFSSDEEEEDNKTPINKGFDDKAALATPFDEHLIKTTKVLNEAFAKVSAIQHQQEYRVKGPIKRQIEVIDPSFEENLGMFNLIKCPDREVQSVLLTLAYLDHEVNKIVLKFEEKYMSPLVTYGIRKDTEQANDDPTEGSGERELGISYMLPIFKEVFDLLKRTSLIMINIVNQLHALYFSKEKFFKDTYKHFDLYSALDTLGKACGVVYTIDLVLGENHAIREDFNRFKNVIKNMYKDPARFNVTETQLKKLEKQLSRYERTILSGACFAGTITQTFDQKPDFHFTTAASNKPIKENSELYNLFTNYWKIHLTKAAEVVASSTESHERKTLFHMFCLYGLYRKLFPQNEDRNLWKQFWTIQKKVPIIIIGSHLIFSIPDYLQNIVQLSRKAMTKDPRDHITFTEDFIDKKDDNFEKEMSGYYSQFVAWATQMDSYAGKGAAFAEHRNLTSVYALKTKLLLSGYLLANQVKQSVTTLVFLHIKKNEAFTPGLIRDINTGCMLLKAIKYIVDENQEGFPAYHLAKTSAAPLLAAIQQYQERVKKIKNPKKEFASALNIFESLFDGPFSSIRKSAEYTCLSFLNYKKDKIIKDNELDDLKYFVWRTHLLANYQLLFKEATDCTFLYWVKDLVPLFFTHIGENPIEMKRFKFLMIGLQDCETQLKSALHCDNKLEVYEAYKQEILSNLQDNLVKRICQEVDDHLRILIHSILIEKLKGKNPFEMPSKPIHHYLINGPVDFFGTIIDPVELVSKHLNETFYNLNVLNLHDYETYEGLRNLAKELFGVDLLNPYLPSQSIEKGNVDILNIMRNIQSFVTHFNYSLFTQTFIESKKDSTILNTIGIRQIADSVQTHGVGILNTSANLVYQFILKKFNTFSQFLYDEMVQTPLRRELRTFRESKDQWEGRYPYSRAEMVAKEIKRLGMFEDNKTFLDKFRILITTIGNALGFVRLLRSASLSYLSKQIEFLPFNISFEDAEMNEDFYLQLTKAANFSGVSCGAANNLDEVIKTLKISFSQRTDYLRILCKVFDGMLGGQENKHLRMFYLLIPSLTLNYIETMINAKERIAKKRAADTFIFDDGFVLGVVYFLRVLGQNNKFDSLHWFEEVKKKFEKDLGGIREREAELTKHKKKGATQEEDNEMNFLMSAQKTTLLLEEFTFFQHSFNTARVLLKEMNIDNS